MSSVKEKIEELKVQHERAFKALGIEDPLFIPRICYTPIGGTEKVVSFFEQDFVKDKDIYTHFVSKAYESEDPENRLWKWKYNPFYETEYTKSDPHPTTGHVRYIIPVEELELIDEKYIAEHTGIKQGTLAFDLEEDTFPNPNEDPLIEEMTIRDFAAIMLKKPISRKKWLNELVK